jgi:hypothetical protein
MQTTADNCDQTCALPKTVVGTMKWPSILPLPILFISKVDLAHGKIVGCQSVKLSIPTSTYPAYLTYRQVLLPYIYDQPHAHKKLSK